MASNQSFVDYAVGQLNAHGEVIAKKMFGEYGLYFEGKFFALICDNKLFIKPTAAGKAYLKNPVEAVPYAGAKPRYLIEEQLEDRAWLSELARITAAALPEPRPKKKKTKK
ncbi:MAG: TfoX/Sxy family protein [Flammeovirgaceae bacterium]